MNVKTHDDEKAKRQEGLRTTKMILFWTRKQQQWREQSGLSEGLAAWLKYQGLNLSRWKEQHREPTFHLQTLQITTRSSWHLSVDSHLHWFGLLFRFCNDCVNIFKSKKPLQWRFWCPVFFFLFFWYVRHWLNYRKSKISVRVSLLNAPLPSSHQRTRICLLSAALLIFWVGQFFVTGDCAVSCRMLSSIPGLYQLDASSALSQAGTNKNDSRHCQIAPSLRSTI